MTSYQMIEALDTQAMLLDPETRQSNNLAASADPRLSSVLHTLNTAYWAHEWALRNGYLEQAEKEAANMARHLSRLAEANCYPYLTFDELTQYTFGLEERRAA